MGVVFALTAPSTLDIDANVSWPDGLRNILNYEGGICLFEAMARTPVERKFVNVKYANT